MKKERLYYLDVVRLLAVISVVTCHFTRNLEWSGISSEYEVIPLNLFGAYSGSFGVSLFFIISGAALMYGYDEVWDLKKYLNKRFISLFPMFWLAYSFGFLYLFYVNGGMDTAIPKYRILLSVLGVDGYLMWFAPNFYILGEWFLGCIILLYLCFPILRRGIKDKPALMAIIIGVVYLLSVWKFKTAMPTDTFFLVRIPEFAFGMYFVKYLKKVNLPILAASIVLLGLGSLGVLKQIPVEVTVPIIGVSAFLTVAFFVQRVEIEPLNRLAIWVSKYAYAIFLTHHIIIKQLLDYFGGSILTRLETYLLFAFCLLVIMIVSVVCYRVNGIIVERVKAEWNRYKKIAVIKKCK